MENGNININNQLLELTLDGPQTIEKTINDLEEGYTGFAPVKFTYESPPFLPIWYDNSRKNEIGYEYSEPPINKNGKYYFDWKEVTINNETWNGYCPYYFEDQTVEEYDMDINIPITPIIYININNTYLSPNVNDKRNSSGVIILKNKFTRIASDTAVTLQNDSSSISRECVNIYKNNTIYNTTYNNWMLDWSGNSGGTGLKQAYGTGWYWFGEASNNYVCHVCLSDDINDLGIFIIYDSLNYRFSSENKFYVSSDKFEFYIE